MDRTVDLLLTNLRREIGRMCKTCPIVYELKAKVTNLEHQLNQQKEIDSLTGFEPLFKPCDCGWIPKPGAVLNTIGEGLFECPDCKKPLKLGGQG